MTCTLKIRVRRWTTKIYCCCWYGCWGCGCCWRRRRWRICLLVHDRATTDVHLMYYRVKFINSVLATRLRFSHVGFVHSERQNFRGEQTDVLLSWKSMNTFLISFCYRFFGSVKKRRACCRIHRIMRSMYLSRLSAMASTRAWNHILRLLLISLFSPKHFVRWLSTDIIEAFPYHMALNAIKAIKQVKGKNPNFAKFRADWTTTHRLLFRRAKG